MCARQQWITCTHAASPASHTKTKSYVMLRPTQRGEGEMVSWKHTQPRKYSDMSAHTSQTATFFCARLFVYVCVSVCVCDIVWSSFTQICLSVSLSLQLSNVAGGGRGDALVLELASHQISLHLLHFLFILYPPPTFLCSPLPFSFTPSDLPLSSCHYYCIKGGRWTR